MENTGVLAGSERASERAVVGSGRASAKGRRGPYVKGGHSELRLARLARGLTLVEVAALAGVTVSAVSKAETGMEGHLDELRAGLLFMVVKIPATAAPATVGSAIRAAREGAGLAQEDFGALVGACASTIVWWEQNRSAPAPCRRQRLFAEVGLDLRAFFPHDTYDESERGNNGPRTAVEITVRRNAATGEGCA